MKLTPGSRLSGGGRDVYEVVGAGWESARHAWWRARKVFWNYRYPDPDVYESDASEWLDVLVRGPLPSGQAPDDFDPDREQMILSALPPSPWFLEPLDFLDPPGGSAVARGPLVVVADPHARRFSELSPRDPQVAARLIRGLTEVLALLDSLHHAGLAVNGLDPEDLLLDETGRWFFIGTDRITRSEAPEALRLDHVHWCRLVARVLTGSDRPEDPGAWPAAEALDRDANEGLQRLRGWVARLGAEGPEGHPAAVEGPKPGAPPRRRLWGWWRGPAR